MSDISVRKIELNDRSDWWPLWQGCIDFYDTTLDDSVSESTWNRFFNPDIPVYCAVAEHKDYGIVGFMIYMVHLDSWSTKDACYLEDLYTDPNHRGIGVGRALIESLRETGYKKGWAGIHWMTAKGNKPARKLYKKLATETDWVRYEIDLTEK